MESGVYTTCGVLLFSCVHCSTCFVGTVCDDRWGQEDAIVACHQLGFHGTATAVRGTQFGVGSSSQPIWLDDLDCTGTEEYLSDCPHRGFGIHNCQHYEDAGVVCEGQEAVHVSL